jgi:hypothetical protein
MTHTPLSFSQDQFRRHRLSLVAVFAPDLDECMLAGLGVTIFFSFYGLGTSLYNSFLEDAPNPNSFL